MTLLLCMEAGLTPTVSTSVWLAGGVLLKIRMGTYMLQ